MVRPNGCVGANCTFDNNVENVPGPGGALTGLMFEGKYCSSRCLVFHSYYGGGGGEGGGGLLESAKHYNLPFLLFLIFSIHLCDYVQVKRLSISHNL